MLKEKLIHSIINHPYRYLISTILLSVILGSGILRLESEYSHKIWFRENDPYLEELDQFERNFGNDETIQLIVRPKVNLFSEQGIELLKRVTELMWQIPHVIRVDSLTNFSDVEGSEQELRVGPFYPDDKKINYEEVSKKVQEHPEIMGAYVSVDFASSIIVAKMAPVERPVIEYNQSLQQLENELKKFDSRLVEFQIGGTVPLNVAFRNTSTSDLEKILPVVVLLLVFFIGLTFKSIKVSSFVLLEIILVIVSTMGMAGWVGIKYSMLISMVPCIVAAIALADTIHIVTTFRNSEGSFEQRLYKSLQKNFLPTIATTVTTVVGFIGLIFTDLLPISNLGALAAFGVAFAWLTSNFIVAPLIIIFRPVVKPSHPIPLHWIGSYVSYLFRFRIALTFIFLLVFTAAFFVGSKNKVNSNIIKYFDESVPVRQANNYLMEHYGGYSGVQIVVDSGRTDGIHDPTFLNKVRELINEIKKHPEITRVNSLLNILERIHRAIDISSELEIPKSSEQVAQEILLYELGLPVGKNINTWFSLDRKLLRLDVLWRVEDSHHAVEVISYLRSLIAKSDLKAEVTGKAALITGLDKYIVKTFSSSIISAFIMVSILMMIILKSFKMGLFSLAPNIIPPMLGLGLLSLMGESIDIGVVLICAITLGIAVDDTIYFLTQFKDEYKNNKQQTLTAIEMVLKRSTAGLIHTSMILILSFSAFLLGSFSPNRNFGILTAFVLLMALICDLVLLPLLLIITRRDKVASPIN